jgi:ABC-type multidrug transport system fused ATPase/permease subunit
VLGIILYFFVGYFSRFCVPVKRLEATTRSPIFSHLTSTIQGLSLIRCHGIQEHLAAKMDQLLDAHGKLYLVCIACDRWLNIRVFSLSSCVLVLAVFLSISLRDALTPGVAALSIVYAITLTGYMQHGAMKVGHCGGSVSFQACNQHTLL